MDAVYFFPLIVELLGSAIFLLCLAFAAVLIVTVGVAPALPVIIVLG